ncbi:hypothetical protein ELS19_17045 [Halogeometricum borinquense]|uniref:Uncharacterized protein n=1 Tax=Halogeometricum borinquense TaxID=60847 RepID=A0A482SXU1_9EURY|nr:hypothetical protein [Halogeometricum borinquense]RYJ08264.1 hypothetical protein ELS19_17045 [Halogeometricum borinquense]
MSDRDHVLSRRTVGTVLLTTLAGCTVLDGNPNERSINLESREVTWRKNQTADTDHTAQILYSRNEAELVITGNFVSSGKLTDLYAHVPTVNNEARTTIDVRLEADVESAQQNRSLYRYLLVLQFEWVPDSDTFILVRHQQANGEITMVDDYIVPKDQTTANSK